MTSLAGPDRQRTRFRRPLGVAVMAYKTILGLSEIVVGILLAVPSFDPQATFARLSAEELREDPGDRFIALVSRHLPALLHHRGLGLSDGSCREPQQQGGQDQPGVVTDGQLVVPGGDGAVLLEAGDGPLD